MTSKVIFKTQLRVFCLLGYKANISGDKDKLINPVVLLHLALTSFLFFGALLFVYENLSNIKLMTDALGPTFTITITIVKIIRLAQNKQKVYNYISKLNGAMDQCKYYGSKSFRRIKSLGPLMLMGWDFMLRNTFFTDTQYYKHMKKI
jgi:hypothetical protein